MLLHNLLVNNFYIHRCFQNLLKKQKYVNIYYIVKRFILSKRFLRELILKRILQYTVFQKKNGESFFLRNVLYLITHVVLDSSRASYHQLYTINIVCLQICAFGRVFWGLD